MTMNVNPWKSLIDCDKITTLTLIDEMNIKK